MTITHLVTHSGGFHADELLSSVILTRLFPLAELIRSRDPFWTNPADEKIIYDVGGVYDSKKQLFDHHQRPCPLRYDNQCYSSFGLIWKHYGMEYLEERGVSGSNTVTIHKTFDTQFVLPIDLMDNGVLEPSVAGPLSLITLPNLLSSLRPAYDDRSQTTEDIAFFKALSIASSFVEAVIEKLSAEARARNVVQQAIASVGDSRILELPLSMPFLCALIESNASHILFVIYPSGSEWTLNGIKLSENTFNQRADLPSSWAGLRGEALESVTGVEGALFCHNARFIATARTRDSIWKMAEIAVQANK